MEHLFIQDGGAAFVPFARSKIKALKATGIRYATRQYEIDGVTVRIHIVGDQDFIRVGSAAVVVAMLYESVNNYIAAEADPSMTGPVNVYSVFAGGSRKLRRSGTYEWAVMGINYGGYEPEPGNLITPDSLNTPYLAGTPACYVGENSAGELALYATDEDRAGDVNGVVVDQTQELGVGTWDAYEINFALRALTTSGKLIP